MFESIIYLVVSVLILCSKIFYACAAAIIHKYHWLLIDYWLNLKNMLYKVNWES